MRLVTFLGADFSDTVNDFLAKNATRVTVVEEGEEHSLESYAVFREYLDLLEVKLQVRGTDTSLLRSHMETFAWPPLTSSPASLYRRAATVEFFQTPPHHHPPPRYYSFVYIFI